MELLKTSGIYTITNLINGKIYLGFTKDFQNRYHSHFNKLKNNVHKNKHLQASFNKYGESNFKFEILEEYPNKKYILASMEHYWANLLNVHNKEIGYNKRPTHPYGKSVNTQEIREEISKANKGKKQSKESRIKATKTYKETIEKRKNDPNWIFREKKISKNKGRKMTEEQKQNLKLKMKGRKIKPESIEKFIKSRTGLKLNLSKEVRENASKRGKDSVKKGIFKPKSQIILLFDLNMNFIKEFLSVKNFCEEFNFSRTTVSRRLSDEKQLGSYYIRYKEQKYIFNKKISINRNNFTKPVLVFDKNMNIVFEGKSLKEVTDKNLMSKT